MRFSVRRARTCVVADAVFEYAVPDEGTAAHADWAKDAPNDTYHSITWKVADLERVEGHLGAKAVRIRTRTDDSSCTDPATSLGVPWGFTTADCPAHAERGFVVSGDGHVIEPIDLFRTRLPTSRPSCSRRQRASSELAGAGESARPSIGIERDAVHHACPPAVGYADVLGRVFA